METEGKTVEAEPKLPRASVEKIISLTLPYTLSCTREIKHLLLNGCAEFVHLIASEANDICEKEQKKTVTHEHVYAALRKMGYSGYIAQCADAYRDYMEQAKLRPSKQNKFKESGLTHDELEREQEALFQKAKLLALSTDSDESRNRQS